MSAQVKSNRVKVNHESRLSKHISLFKYGRKLTLPVP